MTMPHWEKAGTATWVACPHCRTWFPVSPTLVANGTIELVCPGQRCGRTFLPREMRETGTRPT